jgi:O-antigen/teichoic acid export membrane protein
MKRLTAARYRLRILLLMAIYIGLVLFAWPYAKTASSLPLRTLLALLPTLPVIGVVLVMAQRVVRSDELEQRVHMNALGVATAVVCVLSLLGGFLSAAHVVALCVSYALARWLLGRRYGGMGCE